MGLFSKKKPAPPEAPPDIVIPAPPINSLESVGFFEIVDLICEGEIDGFVDENGSRVQDDFLKGVYLDNTPVQTQGGLYNFRCENFTFEFKNGTSTQTPARYFPNISETTKLNLQLFGPGPNASKGEPVLYTVNDPNVNRVILSINVASNSFTDSNGNFNDYLVEYGVEWGVIGGSSQYLERAIQGVSKGPFMFEIPLSLPSDGTKERYIKVAKITEENLEPKVAQISYFDSVTEVIDGRFNYPNSSYFCLRADARAFSSIPARAYHLNLKKVKIPSNYNPITRQYTGNWDGSFKDGLHWTDNPAWIFYDLLTHPRYGLGRNLDPQFIDKWNLYQIGQYCDELVEDGYGGLEPRFTCNVLLNTKAQAIKVLDDFASIFRGMVYWGLGTIFTTQDAEKDPVLNFTNANVEQGNFSYQGSAQNTRFSVVIVRYNDKRDNFKQKIEYVEDPLGIVNFGPIEKEIVAFGCTSRGQANRLGRWALLTSQIETETITFRAGLEASYLRPGDVFTVYDKNVQGKRLYGRVASINYEDIPFGSITLDAPVEDDLTGSFISVIVSKGNETILSLEDKAKVTSEDVENLRASQIQKFEITQHQAGDHIVYVNPIGQGKMSDLAKTPVDSPFVIIQNSIKLRPKEYRVINLKEAEKNKYEVQGLEYNRSKFKSVDENTTFFKEEFLRGGPSINRPDPPLNVALTVNDLDFLNMKIAVSWIGHNAVDSYKIYYRKNDGITRFAGEIAANADANSLHNFEIDINDDFGNYEVRVFSVVNEQLSAEPGKTFDGQIPTVQINPIQLETTFDIRSIEVGNNPDGVPFNIFTEASPLFEWELLDPGGEIIDNAGRLRENDYLDNMQLFVNDIQVEGFYNNLFYFFPFELNAALFGSPQRELDFKVKVIDIFGEEVEKSLHVSNPAPQLRDLEVIVRNIIQVNYFVDDFGPLQAVNVYTGAQSGFALDDEHYHQKSFDVGSDVPLFIENLTVGENYYFKLLPEDAFGTGIPSEVFSGTPIYSADPRFYTPTPSGLRAFSTPEIITGQYGQLNIRSFLTWKKDPYRNTAYYEVQVLREDRDDPVTLPFVFPQQFDSGIRILREEFETYDNSGIQWNDHEIYLKNYIGFNDWNPATVLSSGSFVPVQASQTTDSHLYIKAESFLFEGETGNSAITGFKYFSEPGFPDPSGDITPNNSILVVRNVDGNIFESEDPVADISMPPATRLFLKVRAYDKRDIATAWSEPLEFITAGDFDTPPQPEAMQIKRDGLNYLLSFTGAKDDFKDVTSYELWASDDLTLATGNAFNLHDVQFSGGGYVRKNEELVLQPDPANTITNAVKIAEIAHPTAVDNPFITFTIERTGTQPKYFWLRTRDASENASEFFPETYFQDGPQSGITVHSGVTDLDQNIPAQPSGLQITEDINFFNGEKTFFIDWENSVDNDILYYEISQGEDLVLATGGNSIDRNSYSFNNTGLVKYSEDRDNARVIEDFDTASGVVNTGRIFRKNEPFSFVERLTNDAGYVTGSPKYYWIRAFDANGNVSEFYGNSDIYYSNVTGATDYDFTPPGTASGLAVQESYSQRSQKKLFNIEWEQPENSTDVAYYEVFESKDSLLVTGSPVGNLLDYKVDVAADPVYIEDSGNGVVVKQVDSKDIITNAEKLYITNFGTEQLSFTKELDNDPRYYFVRSVDAQGNKSSFFPTGNAGVSNYDYTPPNAPKGFSVSAAFKNYILTWSHSLLDDGGATQDLSHYEIWQTSGNLNTPLAEPSLYSGAIGVQFPSNEPYTGNFLTDSGVVVQPPDPSGFIVGAELLAITDNNMLTVTGDIAEERYFWIRAVDFAGNKSEFTPDTELGVRAVLGTIDKTEIDGFQANITNEFPNTIALNPRDPFVNNALYINGQTELGYPGDAAWDTHLLYNQGAQYFITGGNTTEIDGVKTRYIYWSPTGGFLQFSTGNVYNEINRVDVQLVSNTRKEVNVGISGTISEIFGSNNEAQLIAADAGDTGTANRIFANNDVYYFSGSDYYSVSSPTVSAANTYIPKRFSLESSTDNLVFLNGPIHRYFSFTGNPSTDTPHPNFNDYDLSGNYIGNGTTSTTGVLLGQGDFIVAQNINGNVDEAWVAFHNALIGSAFISQAAITRAKIRDLAVDDAKVANMTANKLRAGIITGQEIVIGSGADGTQGVLRSQAYQDIKFNEEKQLADERVGFIISGDGSFEFVGQETEYPYRNSYFRYNPNIGSLEIKGKFRQFERDFLIEDPNNFKLETLGEQTFFFDYNNNETPANQDDVILELVRSGDVKSINNISITGAGGQVDTGFSSAPVIISGYGLQNGADRSRDLIIISAETIRDSGSLEVSVFADGRTDKMTVRKTFSGQFTEELSVINDNEFHYFPANADGFVEDYEAANSFFRLYVNNNLFEYNQTINDASLGTGEYRVDNITVGNPLRERILDAYSDNIKGFPAVYQFEGKDQLHIEPVGFESQVSSGHIDININYRDRYGQLESTTERVEYRKQNQGTRTPPIIFRGDYDPSETYFSNPNRVDVVRYVTRKSHFWILRQGTPIQGTVGSGIGEPAGLDVTGWDSFGAEFDSIATDIMLARDATITRGMIFGGGDYDVDGGISGYLRSQTKPAFAEGTGFFLGWHSGVTNFPEEERGDFKFDIGGPEAYMRWDGRNLSLKGSITNNNQEQDIDFFASEPNIFGNVSHFIGGGYGNQIYATKDTATDNIISSGLASAIVAGGGNTIFGKYSFIGGGLLNTGYADFSTIVGGFDNKIGESGLNFTLTGNFIGAGRANCIASGNYNFIGAGEENVIASGLRSYADGYKNEVRFANDSFAKGRYNLIDNADESHLYGSDNQSSWDFSYLFGRSLQATNSGQMILGLGDIHTGEIIRPVAGEKTLTMDFKSGIHAMNHTYIWDNTNVAKDLLVSGDIFCAKNGMDAFPYTSYDDHNDGQLFVDAGVRCNVNVTGGAARIGTHPVDVSGAIFRATGLSTDDPTDYCLVHHPKDSFAESILNGYERVKIRIAQDDSPDAIFVNAIGTAIKGTPALGFRQYPTEFSAYSDTISSADFTVNGITYLGGFTKVQQSLTVEDGINVGNGADINGDTHIDGNLYVYGNIYSDGDTIGGSSLIGASGPWISDARLKNNLTEIEEPLEKLFEIAGYEFDWNEEAKESGHDVGIVAQEIEKVIPEAVVENKDGYKEVHYHKIIPLLIEAVKDQQKIILSQEERIKRLEEKLL